jgi:chorismate mutase / prephenate dehydratase
MSIKDIRDEIDNLDIRILKLLNKRANNAIKIGKLKGVEKKPVYAPGREKHVTDRLKEENSGPLSDRNVTAIFNEIISASRSLESTLRIGYLGPEGTFTHNAAIMNFGKSVDYMTVSTIPEIFHTLDKGNIDFGVVPIENSINGAVGQTYDMFMQTDLKIVAEVTSKITHSLLSKGKLGDITRIYSKDQAIAQCRGWIAAHLPKAELIEVASTAQGAVLSLKDSKYAAIGSQLLAGIHKLKIVAERIEDDPGNTTRFVVIGNQIPAASGRDKTSLMLSIIDKPGALSEILAPFQDNKINLTKIESRPSRRKAWDYLFFLDFLGHYNSKKVQAMLKHIEKYCVFLKVLGSYPYKPLDF